MKYKKYKVLKDVRLAATIPDFSNGPNPVLDLKTGDIVEIRHEYSGLEPEPYEVRNDKVSVYFISMDNLINKWLKELA